MIYWLPWHSMGCSVKPNKMSLSKDDGHISLLDQENHTFDTNDLYVRRDTEYNPVWFRVFFHANTNSWCNCCTFPKGLAYCTDIDCIVIVLIWLISTVNDYSCGTDCWLTKNFDKLMARQNKAIFRTAYQICIGWFVNRLFLRLLTV